MEQNGSEFVKVIDGPPECPQCPILLASIAELNDHIEAKNKELVDFHFAAEVLRHFCWSHFGILRKRISRSGEWKYFQNRYFPGGYFFFGMFGLGLFVTELFLSDERCCFVGCL